MAVRLNALLQAGMSKHEAWDELRAENDAIVDKGGEL
jgi:hypothetical protein